MLTVPATETPSERLFSAAGKVVSDQRTQLLLSNVNGKLFVGKNYSDLRKVTLAGDVSVKVEQGPSPTMDTCQIVDSSDDEPLLPDL